MEKDLRPYTLLKPALVFLIIELLFKLFKYDLIDLLTVFFYPLLEFALNILTVAFFITVVVFSIIKSREFFIRRLWVSLIVSIASCILILLPLGEIAEDLRFKALEGQYTAVAEKALNGDYGTIDIGGNEIQLPIENAGLSRGGGEIFVFQEGENKAVFFFRLRGILDNFSGYVYLKNEESDYLLDEFGDWGEKERITETWYCYYSR